MNVKVFIEDIKDHCCIFENNVIWGLDNIVKFLLTQTTSTRKDNIKINTNKSPY